MFETFSPKNQLLTKYVRYFYRFNSDDKSFRRKLVIFPNVGSAIVFYSGVEFVTTGHQEFIANEKKKTCGTVLHLNRPDPVIITETGCQKRIGIVFKALGLNRFIKCNIDEMLKSRNPTSIPISYFDKDFEILFKETDLAQPLSHLGGIVEEFLLSKLNGFPDSALGTAIEKLSTEGNITISEIARSIPATTKTINRLFHKHIGLSPVEFKRIIQFRRALGLRLENEQTSNNEIAFESNYYDLPYMIKVFRQMTGFNTSDFFKKISHSEDKNYIYMAF